MSDDATATISAGELRGSSAHGIERYLGVPYAAAPVGVHRFGMPAPHPTWDGVRDAVTPGATAPQAPYGGVLGEILPTVSVAGEDILNLNVWTPSGARGLPVMVWVHGGSFAHGSNALDSYDGTTFARDGVVYVSVNYRLGAEGFSVLDGAPLNLGLEDVAAAFRWVRSEIAAFGGDPHNVTAFGESAGSIILGTLLASPGGSSLFDRVIMESGMATAAPRAKAQRITTLMSRALKVPASREAFARQTPERLVQVQTEVTAGSTPVTGGAGFGPVIGGALAPTDPTQALLDGAGSNIPVLIGSNTEEYRLWFVPTGLMSKITPTLFRLARLKFGITGRVLAPYRANRPGASVGELFGALATDILLRLPINRFADSRLSSSAGTWVYEFAWSSPAHDLGAAHAVELPFVFDRLDAPEAAGLVGTQAPQALADEIHAAWVRFATTGDPGWERWNERRPVRMYDHPDSGVEYAPREDERSAWRK